MKKFLLFLVIIANAWYAVGAQQLRSERFVESALSLGGGYTHLLDTYLSPQRYSGGHVMLQSERFGQLAYENGRWYGQSRLVIHGDYTKPASGSGLTIGGMGDYSYTCYYRPLHTNGWSLYMGPQGQLRIGGIYNLRNSNNPAQLKLGVNLAASALGKYSFSLWNTPMSVRLQADMPLFGFAFGPDYGQSYYEIFYLGNAEGCVHMTAPHNNLSLRTGLGYEVQLRSCTMRLTWQEDLYHWRLGNQQYRMFTHSVMLGYVSNLYHVWRDDEARQYIPY
jgi:hypothetical protein